MKTRNSGRDSFSKQASASFSTGHETATCSVRSAIHSPRESGGPIRVCGAINPHHNPTQATLNCLLKPFGFRLSLAAHDEANPATNP